MKKTLMKEERAWRAEADLMTMCEAKKIEKDKDRMKAVRELARKRVTERATLTGADD